MHLVNQSRDNSTGNYFNQSTKLPSKLVRLDNMNPHYKIKQEII